MVAHYPCAGLGFCLCSKRNASARATLCDPAGNELKRFRRDGGVAQGHTPDTWVLLSGLLEFAGREVHE